MVTRDERMLAMAIFVLSLFTTIIGPLLIWLLKKDSSTFIDFYGKEYFNFLISYAIYSLIARILTIVLIGFLILPLLGVGYFLFTIIAAIKAYSGYKYRIPFVIRLFS
ncbi:DUF4870 domain-containing protein [Heyndrickxia ginsengihumi]|uniref:DUF4870 domain-containing protein n=1 Tax=Heyndrickxia ginsengihumi TaxID=363870 RepID=UPI003D2159AF